MPRSGQFRYTEADLSDAFVAGFSASGEGFNGELMINEEGRWDEVHGLFAAWRTRVSNPVVLILRHDDGEADGVRVKESRHETVLAAHQAISRFMNDNDDDVVSVTITDERIAK